MKSFLLFLLMQTVVTCLVQAQSQQEVLNWINTVKADNHDFYYEIPFEYRNDEIVIKVVIGNQVYDYIFDTRGYNDITNEIQLKNSFPVLTTQAVGSSNKLKVMVNLVKVDTLKIGPPLQMNFNNSPTIKCTIDGALIGASLIKNHVWQVDFYNKKIIVTDRLDRLPNIDSSVKVPVTFNARMMPYISVVVNNTPEKLMFDLGSSSFLILTEKESKIHFNKNPIIKINGGSIEGGNGIVRQNMKIIKADSVEINSVKIKRKPILVIPTASESLIGNPIIQNFIVTLNFKNSELYLKPVIQSPVEEGWVTFGLGLAFHNDTVKVTSIYEGLAADKAGLLINDEIIAIDGQEAKYTDECAANKTLSTLLKTKTRLTLTILRDGNKKNIELTRERVY